MACTPWHTQMKWNKSSRVSRNTSNRKAFYSAWCGWALCCPHGKKCLGLRFYR